ncbi:MAG: hypothetical protein ACLQRH_16715 [Acidimicrobiales bacterium]
MPLSPGPVLADDGFMTLLLIHPDSPAQLTARPNRRWVRILVRLFGAALDHQLAQGRPPESNRILAARAQELVLSTTRRSLAQDWAHLLKTARTPPPIGGRRVPLNREGVIACEAELHAILSALVDPFPPAARGAAMVSWLLRDGTGPLYDRRRSAELANALREITAQLEPSFTL